MFRLDNTRDRSGAFTLIELLIVVAIIAILAAIAVPNFLEAQVRSKVSRSQADMRSIATAMESYAVDYNDYPPDGTHPNDWLPEKDLRSYLPRLTFLTTPVSYMTAVPTDPFAQGFIGKVSDPAFIDPYRVPFGTGDIVYPLTFDYAKLDPGEETWWHGTMQTGKATKWGIRSIGPDTNATWLGATFGGDPIPMYDSTNGTKSDGDLFYFGPGVGFRQEQQ